MKLLHRSRRTQAAETGMRLLFALAADNSVKLQLAWPS
jgi:hypothetical protein